MLFSLLFLLRDRERETNADFCPWIFSILYLMSVFYSWWTKARLSSCTQGTLSVPNQAQKSHIRFQSYTPDTCLLHCGRFQVRFFHGTFLFWCTSVAVCQGSIFSLNLSKMCSFSCKISDILFCKRTGDEEVLKWQAAHYSVSMCTDWKPYESCKLG